MELTNQQYQAFKKFKELRVGALFMEQGTGKTRVALDLVRETDSDLVIFFVLVQQKITFKQKSISGI